MVTRQLAKLQLRQLDKVFDRLREAKVTSPAAGWLCTIRESLGMSMAQFGRRLGMPRQGIQALEAREASGAVTLKSLRAAADALDADLVYAIVPRQPLSQVLREQAGRKALGELARVSHTMHLEQQGVGDKEATQQLEDRTNELLHEWPRSLWDLDPR